MAFASEGAANTNTHWAVVEEGGWQGLQSTFQQLLVSCAFSLGMAFVGGAVYFRN